MSPIPAPAGLSPNPYSVGASARGVKRPLDDQNFLWGTMNGNKKGKADGSHGPPPASYTCHKCKEAGVSLCQTKWRRGSENLTLPGVYNSTGSRIVHFALSRQGAESVVHSR
jgi:hypothetical protein